MDTLIFNSYVGGACIFEYHKGKIELLRATEKYAQMIGSSRMTVEDALKLDWADHLDSENLKRVTDDMNKSIKTKNEITSEYIFLNLPGCPKETYLRSAMRVIAAAGERYLVYCTIENMTAQRLAEQKERRIAQRLKVIMENMNSGISALVADENGLPHTVFANDRYFSMLGYTREQAERELPDLRTVVHPLDRSAAKEVIDGLLKDHLPRESEYRVVKRDGSVIYVHASKSFASVEGYGDDVIISVLTDITDRVLAEQSARRVAGQLQAVMDNVDLGIVASVVKDGALSIFLANDRFYSMRGYTKSQYEREISRPHSIITESLQKKVLSVTLEATKTGKPCVMEYEITRRDGEKRYFRNAISIAKFDGIDLPVQLSIFRDITEERLAQDSIRRTSEQLQTFMDDMPGGFARLRVYADRSLKPVYINDGFCRIVGMSRDEVIGIYENDSLAGVSPDDVPYVMKAVSKMMESRESMSLRCRIRRKGGEYMWMNVFCRVTSDAQGNLYLNSYYTDAEEQIRAERRQKEILDNLPNGAALYELRDGRLTVKHINRRYWQLVGRPSVEYEKDAFLNSVYPDDRLIVGRELNSAIRENRDAVCDIRILSGNGGYETFHVVGRIVPGDDGVFSIYTSYMPSIDETPSYQRMLPILMSAMMQATTDLTFAKGRDFCYIAASRAFANMVGAKDADEIIGKTDYDLFDREMADKFRADDESMFATGDAIVDMIEMIPSRDDVPCYSSTSKYLLKDEVGNVIGLYGIGRDVTGAVAKDSQLLLVNNSIPGGLATYVCTPGEFCAKNVRRTYINDGFLRLFGYSREEYDNDGLKDPMRFVYDEDRKVLSDQWKRLMLSGVPVNYLFRAHIKGGGYKWISINAVAADRKNETVIINAILQDVTEQRELIEKLRISQAENSLAAKLGDNVICRFVVADRTLTLASESSRSMSIPETVNDVPYEQIRLGLISPESSDAYLGFFESIMRGSKAVTATFQQKYSGVWRWTEAKGSTVFSDDGKPVKAVISFRDVTEQIEKECQSSTE